MMESKKTSETVNSLNHRLASLELVVNSIKQKIAV